MTIERLLAWWNSLNPGTRFDVMMIYMICTVSVMAGGWLCCFDESGNKLDRKRARIMAMATLCLPLTCALSPLIVAAVLIWGLGMLASWLIETAAGQE